jgi:hypothetical protein
VEGLIKSGASISALTVSGNSDIAELTDKDMLVLCGGANDVNKNNTSEGLKYINKFVQVNKHTNIILTSVPHRYDLPEWSCVNYEVQTFNRKLMKMMKPYKHVTILKVNLDRKFYNRHGLHMNNVGKDKIAAQIAQITTNILQDQRNEPITLQWNKYPSDDSIQALSEEGTKINNNDKEVIRTNDDMHVNVIEEVKDSTEKLNLALSSEKLVDTTTKTVRSSKRVKKPVLTKKTAFLG